MATFTEQRLVRDDDTIGDRTSRAQTRIHPDRVHGWGLGDGEQPS